MPLVSLVVQTLFHSLGVTTLHASTTGPTEFLRALHHSWLILINTFRDDSVLRASKIWAPVRDVFLDHNFTSILNYSVDYPRCLREWGRSVNSFTHGSALHSRFSRRFEANWTEELGATMMARYPELKDPESMEMFRRKWAYMFSYMEVAYSRWWLGLTCWSVKRPVWIPSLML